MVPSSLTSLRLVKQRRLKLEITAVAAAGSGRAAAIAAGKYQETPQISIWDLERFEPVLELVPNGVIRAIAWSADERILATGCGPLWKGGIGSPGPSTFLWDTATGAELARFGDELWGVRAMAFSPDGRWLLTASMLGETPLQGSSVDLWVTASGRLATRLAQVGPRTDVTMPYFTAVAITPDGSMAIAGCDRNRLPPASIPGTSDGREPWWWNRGVRTWQLPSTEEIDHLRSSERVRTLAVSADGKGLFLAGDHLTVMRLDGGTVLWEMASDADNIGAASTDLGSVAEDFAFVTE